VKGLVADLTPMDSSIYFSNDGRIVCPAILGYFPHTSSLHFSTPGRAVVRVHGRREPGNKEVDVERAVVVR
jgi:hypothetical protein